MELSYFEETKSVNMTRGLTKVHFFSVYHILPA